MTQGAGQGPVVRTATLRDFRVPAYVHQGELPDAPAGHAGTEVPGSRATDGAYGPAPVYRPETPVHGQDVNTFAAHDGSTLAARGADEPAALPHPAGSPRAAAVPPQPAAAPATAAPRHVVPQQQVPPLPLAPQQPPAPVARQEAPAAPRPDARAEPPAARTAGHTATHTTARSRTALTPDPDGAFAHPGGTRMATGGAEDLEYSPTQRDLPIVNRGDTVQVPVVTEQPVTDAEGEDEPLGALYVVGDVHGYLSELVAALRKKGLIDAEGNWSAGNTRLWFLGDFTDRGPDGIGVIDLVMRLSAQAAAAGGYCKALMGNHELLLIGARRFGDTPVNSGAGTATFQAAWLLNGGQKTDMERLEDHHLQWMCRLDAMEEEDGHLLLHSDTTAYLEFGDSIEAVNDTVRETLTRNDADECWDLFRKFTKRFAFRDEGGADAVRELLGTYGGTRVVHGHSPIPYLTGEVGPEDGEDGSGPVVNGPYVYADGLAVAMDGGVTMDCTLLVCRLPLAS